MNKLRIPLLFVGHGTPMNAITENNYSQEWQRIGKEIKEYSPKAIVCMSAHWASEGSLVTSNLKPETIHDFYGFPEELYQIFYKAPGSPELAEKIHQKVPGIGIATDWGIDHGTWSVLKWMFSEAKIPVLQLSIDYSKKAEEQFETIKKLRELRNEGILFIGSGNIVHNLGMARDGEKTYDWAIEFEETCKNLIKNNEIEKLIDYEKLGEAARMSIPTDDHYRPMLNTLALKFDDEEVSFFNQGIDLASVSMLSFEYK